MPARGHGTTHSRRITPSIAGLAALRDHDGGRLSVRVNDSVIEPGRAAALGAVPGSVSPTPAPRRAVRAPRPSISQNA
ncbi:MAG: hypothetical protein ACYDEH_11165 [Acidimicrobiales bacterium]